jgi:prophage antirepressor-like protein
MNELQIFENNEFGQVRTVEENEKIMFCGSDVAKALGYARPKDAISAHCKGAVKYSTPTNGGNQQMLFITEGDVYRLITHSKLPSAEKFESWVFDEVLPTIRKHGAYMTENTMEQVINDPDFGIMLLTQLKAERDKLKQKDKEIEIKNQLIGELKPKADYTDRILQNPGLVNINQIAKDYGMSARSMNKLLEERKIQYKQGKQWLLYKKYQNKGYTSSETIDITRSDGSPDVVMRTKWTQKGRLFIYELLKADGIRPVIETQFNVIA